MLHFPRIPFEGRKGRLIIIRRANTRSRYFGKILAKFGNIRGILAFSPLCFQHFGIFREHYWKNKGHSTVIKHKIWSCGIRSLRRRPALNLSLFRDHSKRLRICGMSRTFSLSMWRNPTYALKIAFCRFTKANTNSTPRHTKRIE